MNRVTAILGAGSERPREAIVATPPSAAEIAFLLLGPIAAVIVFHISVINQAGDVDPEYYTGYGYSFARMWREFGPTYYAIRFPVTFLDEIFQCIDHGLAGYELLRLLIFWGAGIPLFLMTRRLYGAAIACAAYAFLFLNPLLPLAMLWDLTTFLAIPAALSGIAVWHLHPNRAFISSIASGFLFCVSVNSHAFTGTALLLFLMVEFAFALADPAGRRHIPRDIAGLVIGSAACMALGLLFFWVQVGFVSPRILWSVTLTAIRSGHGYSATHYVPLSQFFDVNYDVYVPYITTALAVAALRGSLFENTIEARITWFAILYCAAYAFAVLVLRMNIVTYSWYLSHLAIVSYLTVPVLLGHARAASDRFRAGLFGLGLLIPLAVVRIWPAFTLSVYGMAHGSPTTVAIIALVAIVAGLSLSVGPRHVATAAALFVAAVIIQAPLLSARYLDTYIDSPSRAAEAPLYRMIRQYQALLDQYDKPDQRVRIWYVNDPSDLFLSLASSNLHFTVQSPWSRGPVPGILRVPETGYGMPEIGPYERRSLADPNTKYVLLVARAEGRVARGLAALAAAGIKAERIKEELWGELPFTAHALLVRIVGRDATPLPTHR